MCLSGNANARNPPDSRGPALYGINGAPPLIGKSPIQSSSQSCYDGQYFSQPSLSTPRMGKGWPGGFMLRWFTAEWD
jgi:hypothetical protein